MWRKGGNMGLREVSDAIRKFDNYLIASHINIEGDAIGSQLALYFLVKQLGKNALLINQDVIPERYRFLPGCDKIQTESEKIKGRYDNAIIADCPTAQRTGRVVRLLHKAKVRINIDHHISNESFGEFNWVDPDASSCGEMVFRLYRHMGLSINEDIATLLYVALLTDTGSFQYDSTTPTTHSIAAELIKLGVHPTKVASAIYETKSLGDITLLSKALSTLSSHHNGKIALLYVTADMLHDTHTTPDRTDGFVNFARSLKDAEVALFFREDYERTGHIHVSLRSKGRVNVNVLANTFGGGGHPKASGCLIEGELAQVIERVVRKAREFLV